MLSPCWPSCKGDQTMNLQLRSIIAPGIIANERLSMRATTELDLGDYLVAQSGYVGDSPALELFHTCWFPFHRVSKGDLVVIYTKTGETRSRKLDGGNTAHFYYLDLTAPIWNKPNRGALILLAPEWSSKSTEDLTNR